MDAFISILMAVAVGAWVWAAGNHFQSEKLPPGAKLIGIVVLAGAVFMTYLIFARRQPVAVQGIGAILILASLGLFALAIRETRMRGLLVAFAEGLPEALVTTGPYRYVRHPFYSSYMLAWIGMTMATASLLAVPVLVAMCVLYWRAARDEEEKFASTPHATRYRDYFDRTGRFFPKLFSNQST